MSLPNGSIANLFVTRKSLGASIDKKANKRAFGSRCRACSRSFVRASTGTNR
jgi:hypothetical protein